MSAHQLLSSVPRADGDPGDHSHRWLSPLPNGIPEWFRGGEVVLRKSKPDRRGAGLPTGIAQCVGWELAGWRGDLCGCYCAAGMNFRAPTFKRKK